MAHSFFCGQYSSKIKIRYTQIILDKNENVMTFMVGMWLLVLVLVLVLVHTIVSKLKKYVQQQQT